MTKRGLALLGLFAHGAGCGRNAEVAHAAAGAPAQGGGGSGVAQVPLGDLLPVALRLDCSLIGDAEPPTELYLSIAEPYLQTGTLTARLEGALCAEHDVSALPDAPAAVLRCPPRQVVRSDSYPAPCTDHYIELAVCSPGFEELKLVLQNLGPCSRDEPPAPSCSDLQAGVASGYPFERVTYELRPLGLGSSACPSFVEPPQVALAEEPLYACPCSAGGE